MLSDFTRSGGKEAVDHKGSWNDIATSQEMLAATRSEEKTEIDVPLKEHKGMHSPHVPPEEVWPYQYLHFSPVTLISDFWPQNCGRINFCYSKPFSGW